MLDFTSGAGFDSRITFTRGSNATLVDSTGKITYAPANFFTFSEQFDNAAWVKQAGGTASIPVVTANAGTAPDGTATADRVQMTLNGGTTTSDAANVNQPAAYPAGSLNLSIWLRSNTGVNQTVLLVIGNTQPGGGLVTVTPTWQRFTVSQSVAAAGTSNSGIRLRGTFTGDTADILVWGAQLEPVTYQTTAGTYNPTTTAAYYGPRFDYDPVTLAAKGLLIEEQRVNLLTYSAQFDDVAWVKDAATVTANATTAPDGTSAADKVIATATTAFHAVRQSVTGTVASYTYSVYAKASEYSKLIMANSGAGTWSATFDLATGTTIATGGAAVLSSSIQSAGSGWYRCSVTFTGAAALTAHSIMGYPNTGATLNNFGASYTGDGTSGIFLWGAQLEQASFPTSYIPTVASTVTRSADVATMTGTNFSSWYNASEGTLLSNATFIGRPATVGNGRTAVISDGTGDNLISAGLRNNANSPGMYYGQVNTGGTTQAILPSSIAPDIGDNVIFKSVIAYKVNDIAATANGATVLTDTSATIPTVNRMVIGGFEGTSNFLNGHIRSIAYYNTRLTNTELQTLTAPQMNTTLRLDFINGIYEG
jgi:hypothetical protein